MPYLIALHSGLALLAVIVFRLRSVVAECQNDIKRLMETEIKLMDEMIDLLGRVQSGNYARTTSEPVVHPWDCECDECEPLLTTEEIEVVPDSVRLETTVKMMKDLMS